MRNLKFIYRYSKLLFDSIIGLTFVLLIFGSCHKDEQEPGCLFSKVIHFGDFGETYEYTDHRLSTIVYFFSDGRSVRKFDMTYDAKGQLTDAVETDIASGTPVRKNKFTYGTNGKPSSLVHSLYDGPDVVITNYKYDSRNRLTTMDLEEFNYQGAPTPGNALSRCRYEYDGNDNVIKIYYSGGVGSLGPESLTNEQFAFDDHARFYANSPGLDIISIYLDHFEPSKHNVLRRTGPVSTSPTQMVFETADITYTYDSRGNVTSIVTSNSSVTEYAFASAEYKCP